MFDKLIINLYVYTESISQAEPQIFTPSKYFVIPDLQTLLHTQFVGRFMIYQHTQYHSPRHYK
jgi:hypothetical protein